MPRWITLGIIGIAGYFAWRKWGSGITSAVTSIAK